MFEKLFADHRIFVNTARSKKLYDHINQNAEIASETNLVHLYIFELDKNFEVQSNVDVYIYRNFTFYELDNNVFEVRFKDEENVRVTDLHSYQECIQYIVSNSSIA